MITEKDLLKWGFVRGEYSEGYLCTYEGNAIWFYPDCQRLMIYSDGDDYLDLSYCPTKRKADQALRLLGLPPIDKLKEIKK